MEVQAREQQYKIIIMELLIDSRIRSIFCGQ